jgi:hypothetical protein
MAQTHLPPPLRFLARLARVAFLAPTLCAIATAAGVTKRADLPAPGPRHVVVLAADAAAPGLETVPDPAALGGRYLKAPTGYRPAVFAGLPTEGDPVLVWVRYRALALQMKILEGGKQQETPWNWDTKDKAFGWRAIGPYSRELLGDGILFIAAPTDDPRAGIDAVVVTTDPAFRPDGSAPLPGMPNAEDATVKLQRPPEPESDAPGSATVSVRWEEPGPSIPPDLYSINSFVGFEPAKLSTPGYPQGLAYLAPGLVRFHHAGMLGHSSEPGAGWFDPQKQTWDREKIARAVALWPAVGTRLVNICGWPSEWDKNRDNRLDPDRHDDFARLCADLVRLINGELRAGVTHWEISNEKDGAYWVDPSRNKEDHLDELAALYLKSAAAVRAVQPDAKIGGPAAMRPDFYGHLARFVRATRDQLDFLSVHTYASGVLSERDQSIYDKTEVMAGHAAKLAKILREEAAGRPVELHLNEWNISWTWETQEPRMVNHKGAVFDALGLIAFAGVDGLDVTNAWNDMDGTYGKMNHDASLRPGAHVFHHFNACLRGARVPVASSEPRRVVAFATAGPGGARGLVLVNRTNGAQTVALEGDFAGDWSEAVIDADGHRLGAPGPAPTAPRVLAPHSATFLWRR